MKMTLGTLYQTSEFALVVSLVTFGFKIEAIDRTKNGRAEFAFNRSKGLDEIVAAFWRSDLTVPVVAFYQNQKLIKSRLRNDNG